MFVFLLPVAAGALLGKLAGGSFVSLASVSLRFAWIAALSAVLQVIIVFVAPDALPRIGWSGAFSGSGPTSGPAGVDPAQLVLPLAIGLLGIFVALNCRLPGMWLVLAGLLANLLVIVANGGLMPIRAELAAYTTTSVRTLEQLEHARTTPGVRLSRSKNVVLAWEDTRLPWLSDTLLTPPVPRRLVMSMGDVAIALGLTYLAARTVWPQRAMRSHARYAT